MREHPFSAYDLDCYHSEVMEHTRIPSLEAHLEGCDDCASYLAQLSAQKQQLLGDKPTALFVEEVFAKAKPTQQTQSSPWELLQRLLFSRPALVGAFTCLAIVLGAFYLQPTKNPQLRWMGGKQFIKAFVKRGTSVTLATRITHVREGDALRFQSYFSKQVHLIMFFMDAKGNVSWVVPAQPSRTPQKMTTGKYTFPGSLIFDNARLTERVFVYWDKQTFAPNSIVKKIKDAWVHKKQSSFQDDQWLPRMKNLWSLSFVKQ
ncbi:MAG TPA: hypothetical protein DCE42_22295 [Myxococcales bacterium]|nr:hypothetical protein [Deltaproteobacteria bacterium]MBU52092.1 hypothetical protein [Deltaproteobacteria bacterium]HAA57513.1 hypothetical protein [Myxococcales bacterium]|tara:strand:+ start:1442 stop:2224 length:783 start_codon:yes stop_codon:yes gene_type:complete